MITGTENPYNYNGKELSVDFDLDWLDYGARWYDASLARWSVVDPLAEKAPNWTPYRYGFNNPLKFIDPDGRFEIEKSVARENPKLKAYLENIEKTYKDKPDKFRAAFKQYSELNDEQIAALIKFDLVEDGQAIEYNQANPRIQVEELSGANGVTPPAFEKGKWGNKGIIKLDKGIVDNFEKDHKTLDDSDGAKLLLESTLFHEATHYGDLSNGLLSKTGFKVVNGKLISIDKNNMDGKKEGGKSFEKAVYGTDIGTGENKTEVIHSAVNYVRLKNNERNNALMNKSEMRRDNTSRWSKKLEGQIRKVAKLKKPGA